ncbi:hypothetical protein [Flagellimonas sp. S3867]|uniref:hypothetical protein n=1 Tax=Flagellimonas sp. S3867 TaxID=2768063 RepID=UPI001689AFCF|nr:hypothetical protein [Flagellimonas sp. S3867]
MRKIESGTILSLKLEHNLGKTFLKVVNFDDLSELDLSKGLHLALYSYQYILSGSNSFNLNDFKNATELVGPLLTSDIIFAIRQGFYEKITSCPLRNYEKKIPAMKSFAPAAFEPRYEENAIHWKYFENGSPFEWRKSNYDEVKHLERNTAYNYKQITTRLSMELIRKRGEDIGDFYDLDNPYFKSIHQTVIFTMEFDKVPDDRKGIVG